MEGYRDDQLALAGWGLAFVVLLATFPREFFPKLKSDKPYQHLVFATAVFLFVLWSLQAGVREGLSIHFLGVTTLVLSHGWRIANFICLAPTALLVAFGLLSPGDVGAFAVTSFLLPGLFSYLIFVLTYQYLTRHLFIYIFVAGFISAALTIVLSMVLTAVWLWLEGRYPWETISHDYLQLSLLVWFPEA